MTFANPTLLIAGLAAISLPILIHFLMRRRRRPIAWAAMRFLLEAYKQQQRRLKLEQLILLVTRCALIALLALAIGRPMLRAAGMLGSDASTLIVWIDTSLTSQATDEQGRTALERHKAQADQLLAALRPGSSGDRAALIALGGPAQGIVWPPSADVPGVRRALEELRATDSRADFEGAIKLVQGSHGPEGTPSKGMIAVISDFLTGSAELKERLTALPAGIDWTVVATPPATAGSPNTVVVDVEAQRGVMLGTQPVLVTARLARRGGSLPTGMDTVRFRLEDTNGQVLSQAQATTRWEAGKSEATASAMLDTPGDDRGLANAILVATVTSSGIQGDDTARRVLEKRQSFRVTIIAPRNDQGDGTVLGFTPGQWMSVALSPDVQGQSSGSHIDVSIIEPALADASRLSGQDALIIPSPEAIEASVWTRVRTFVESGGLVILSVPPIEGVHTWPDGMLKNLALDWTIAREPMTDEQGRALAAQRPTEIPQDLLTALAPELTMLTEPVRVFRWLPVTTRNESGPPLLALADGTPLLIAGTPGSSSSRGLVVMLTTALDFDWTNLPAKPLFPALMPEVVRQGIAAARGMFVSVAGDRPVLPPASTQAIRLSGEPMVLPIGESNRTTEPVRNAGLWRATDAQGVTKGLVVVKADGQAGHTEAQASSDVQAWLGTLGAPVRLVETQNNSKDAVTETPADRGSSLRLGLRLLLGVLALAVVELGLARWFSHAAVIRKESQA